MWQAILGAAWLPILWGWLWLAWHSCWPPFGDKKLRERAQLARAAKKNLDYCDIVLMEMDVYGHTWHDTDGNSFPEDRPARDPDPHDSPKLYAHCMRHGYDITSWARKKKTYRKTGQWY